MKSIDALDLINKTVFIRVDYNVPLGLDGKVKDDRKIRATLPTLKKAIEAQSKLILASHLGRPKGKIMQEFSLRNISVCLSELLEKQVIFAGDCIGEEVERKKLNLRNGDVLLLENLRFHAGETNNDPEFSRQLAKNINVYINDAFGASHRAHASVVGMPAIIKEKGYGYLIEKELAYLGDRLSTPEKPYLAIIGGAKVSDKILVLEQLINKINILLIGGAMAYTFLKALDIPVGSSLVENDLVETAAKLIELAKKKGVELLLPIDHIIADSDCANAVTTKNQPIADGWSGFDIGPKTIALFEQKIAKARTVFWNGPLGKFEDPTFSQGTFAIAEALARSSCCSVVGGGDSAAAIEQAGLSARIDHISTGGGASLEFIEGKSLPGLAALKE